MSTLPNGNIFSKVNYFLSHTMLCYLQNAETDNKDVCVKR